MKTGIHPKYYDKATITCACGAKFEVGSTVEKIEVEICSQCHPFYTGKEKLVDTAGRVDKFKARMEAAKKHEGDDKAQSKTGKKDKLKSKVDIKSTKSTWPSSLTSPARVPRFSTTSTW